MKYKIGKIAYKLDLLIDKHLGKSEIGAFFTIVTVTTTFIYMFYLGLWFGIGWIMLSVFTVFLTMIISKNKFKDELKEIVEITTEDPAVLSILMFGLYSLLILIICYCSVTYKEEMMKEQTDKHYRRKKVIDRVLE